MNPEKRSLLWLSRCANRAVRAVAIITIISLASCISNPAPPPPASAAAARPEPPVTVAASPTHSLALTLDGYKRDVARHIYRSSNAALFDGQPPPVLRSVIVLSIKVDAAGRPTQVLVLRSNGYRNLEKIAVESVRNAAPLPMPNRLVAPNLARSGALEYTETWLFRDDERFQIRSLAQAQANIDD